MKDIIQNYKTKFQKTLNSVDLSKNPELELVVTSMQSKIDLADYLLEKDFKTQKELESLKTELEGMKYQIRCSSGCFDLNTKAKIIFRLDSKIEFLKELIEDFKEFKNQESPIFEEVQGFLSETLERANDLRDRIGNEFPDVPAGQAMNKSELHKYDLLDEFCSKLVETIQEWKSELWSERMRLWK